MFKYRDTLSSAAKGSYDEIERSLLNKQMTCKLSRWLQAGDIDASVQAVFDDHPEFYFVDMQRIQVAQSLLGNHLVFESTCSSSDRTKVDVVLEKIEKGIRARNSDKDALSGYRYVHDMVIRNVKYPTGVVEPRHRSIVGPLLTHEAVCSGYAKLFKHFLSVIEIPSIIVSGQARTPESGGFEPHMWNMVFLSGYWMHCDITWDALSSWKNAYSYGYSYLTDIDIRSDHRIASRQIPGCGPIPDTVMAKTIRTVRIDDVSRIFAEEVGQCHDSFSIRVRNYNERALVEQLYIGSKAKSGIAYKYLYIPETSTLTVGIERT